MEMRVTISFGVAEIADARAVPGHIGTFNNTQPYENRGREKWLGPSRTGNRLRIETRPEVSICLAAY